MLILSALVENKNEKWQQTGNWCRWTMGHVEILFCTRQTHLIKTPDWADKNKKGHWDHTVTPDGSTDTFLVVCQLCVS